MSASQRPVIMFPCDFPIKAFGLTDSDFQARVVGLVRHHAPDLPEGAISCRLSRQGKYIAVTMKVRAHSQEQLDAIYRDLTTCRQVLMAL